MGDYELLPAAEEAIAGEEDFIGYLMNIARHSISNKQRLAEALEMTLNNGNSRAHIRDFLLNPTDGALYINRIGVSGVGDDEQEFLFSVTRNEMLLVTASSMSLKISSLADVVDTEGPAWEPTIIRPQESSQQHQVCSLGWWKERPGYLCIGIVITAAIVYGSLNYFGVFRNGPPQ